MTRISLDIDEAQLTFTTEIVVRTTDLNVANHLGNDSVVTILSEARSRFFADAGVVELPMVAGIGPVGIVVTDLAIVYQGQAHHWDELVIKVGLADPNKYGGDVVFVMTRKSDAAPIAKAKAGIVFFDYDAGTIAPMPEGARRLFA